MKTLILGATGATGQLLVAQLLDRGQKVTAIVRSPDRLPQAVRKHPNLTVVEASILELTNQEIIAHVQDCSAIVSCLGHRLSFKGIFWRPWRLVTDATRRLCEAMHTNSSEQPAKYILMNTTGNRNRDLLEPISFAQRCVIGLLRVCVPPHADNERAADYLRTHIGQSSGPIEWVAVRPDSLTNEDTVTDYELHPSPTRSAIFDAGKTSRINVAHFMAELVTDPQTWRQWQGKMPVIYNKE